MKRREDESASLVRDGLGTITSDSDAQETGVEAYWSRYAFDIRCRRHYYATRVAFFELVDRVLAILLLIFMVALSWGIFAYGMGLGWIIASASVGLLAFLFSNRLTHWEQVCRQLHERLDGLAEFAEKVPRTPAGLAMLGASWAKLAHEAPARRIVTNALSHNALCQSMGMAEACLIRVSSLQRWLAPLLDVNATSIRQAFRRQAIACDREIYAQEPYLEQRDGENVGG
ncbi:hypothetical protein H8I69_18575 [Serratia fonticola]|uniref:hypothetical protein n=1 Tax=Serratia fonticola TaxID=47917 RepID=UPI0015C61487|nr:hypothetical protein [Serratia fonticola]MBC3381129.1 hypothetical protein [Serratia fonticola]NYA40328.1 hypothetical protein [Serratia fonticola]